MKMIYFILIIISLASAAYGDDIIDLERISLGDHIETITTYLDELGYDYICKSNWHYNELKAIYPREEYFNNMTLMYKFFFRDNLLYGINYFVESDQYFNYMIENYDNYTNSINPAGFEFYDWILEDVFVRCVLENEIFSYYIQDMNILFEIE